MKKTDPASMRIISLGARSQLAGLGEVSPTPALAAQTLIEGALQNGGRDNVTAGVFDERDSPMW